MSVGDHLNESAAHEADRPVQVEEQRSGAASSERKDAGFRPRLIHE